MILPIEQVFNDLKLLQKNSNIDESILGIQSDIQYEWYYQKDKPIHSLYTCSFDDNHQKILSHTWNIHALEENWDGYNSSQVSQEVIQNALTLINKIPYQSIQILHEDDINPTPNGTILIEWYYKDSKLSLEIGTKKANYYKKKKDAISYKENDFDLLDEVATIELSNQLNNLFN